LTALVSQSLLAEEEGPDQTTRYRLLETMRAYARQHLTAAQLIRLHRAHARFYTAFAQQAGGLDLFGPAQMDWQHRIQAERDNLHAAITWALTRSGQDPRLAFRIVAALLGVSAISPVIVRGWAEACLTRLDACPPELRAPVLAAAARNAYLADDFPLAHRRAEQALAEPAPGDLLISLTVRATLAVIYAITGQPERAIGIAREARQEAADRGMEEVIVGLFLVTEAVAWTVIEDYAAARPPAMEAVEIARRVRNPALSAAASWAAAEAMWRSEPQAALLLIEDSLALTHAGAGDTVLGNALTLAALIRARNGDLPGALAAVQEATLQRHADGTRLLLGQTLRVAAGILAGLGEAAPAAVLSGALAAHFPGSILAKWDNAQMTAGQTQALARHTLGEAAYNAAASRGAAMDDDEVVGYAVAEFRRVAVLLTQPGASAPQALPDPASGPQVTAAVPPRPA
jgi:hypothetical protein